MGSARLLCNSDEFVTLLVNVEDLKSDIKILPKEQKGYVNALDITQMSPKGLAGRAKDQRRHWINATGSVVNNFKTYYL